MRSSDEGSNIFRLLIIMSACSSRRSWMLCSLAVLVTLVSQSEGGCQDTGLCCFGQNQSCITEDWRKDRSYGECYCDQACKTTLDCCHDYDLACPAMSCVVSEWSVWSGCLEPCKPTLRSRWRQVIQEVRNGGEPCPALHQTAGCAEYHDQHGPCLQSLVPALITTGGYGNARKKREVFDNNITRQLQSSHTLDAVPEGGASGVCGVPATSTGPGSTLLLRGRGEHGTGQEAVSAVAGRGESSMQRGVETSPSTRLLFLSHCTQFSLHLTRTL
ncbi:hypothetical protein PO909_005374 [Leuciscus waleckii]